MSNDRLKFFTLLAIACSMLLAILIGPLAHAEIEGVSYGEAKIHGKNYRFPLGNTEREQEFYFLKKALNGDKEAREVFLEGSNERWWFIGEVEAIWIRVTKDDIQVIKP